MADNLDSHQYSDFSEFCRVWTIKIHSLKDIFGNHKTFLVPECKFDKIFFTFELNQHWTKQTEGFKFDSSLQYDDCPNYQPYTSGSDSKFKKKLFPY